MVENLQAFEKKGFQFFATEITVIIIEERIIHEKLFYLFNTDKLYTLTNIGFHSNAYICVVTRGMEQ